jgi:MEMO1 family protein
MPEPHREQAIRPAAVAGLFYPANPSELRSAIEDLLANSKVTHKSGSIRAVIAPHAGYVYSGPVAAKAFASLRVANHHVGRAVIIGPAHRMRIQGIAVPSARAFATPLGNIALDATAIQEIVTLPSVVVDDEPHANEHALEVELPFLQTVLGSVRIVPLLVGLATPQEVAEVLSRLWDDDTVIVVSSDLSHYLRYEDARRRDCATAEAIDRLDAAAIDFEDACGAIPIRGLLNETKRRNLSIECLDLRNSGDTAGDRDRVVGYGAWAIRAGCSTSKQ